MNGLFGFRIRTSHYLTVAGEPVEVLAPEWRERAERNDNRALAHAYGYVSRATGRVRPPARFESLTVTRVPQVPDPNIYRFDADPNTLYCHPVTAQRLSEAAERLKCDMREQMNALTSRALLYGY